jgi:hypothetical protein
MTPKEIESWIQKKKDEKIGFFFKIRKYVARSNGTGFMIRERRFNNYQSFKPRVIGKYSSTLRNTRIDLKIIPSYTGILFFSTFLLGFPLVILISDNININGSFTSDLSEKFKMVGMIYLIVIPLMLWTLIRPVYNVKIWIEEELRLIKIK